MHDEISIKEDVEWDGKCFRGYVDVGDGVYDDDTPLALIWDIKLEKSF